MSRKLKGFTQILLGFILVITFWGSIIYIVDRLGIFDEDESTRCGPHKHIRIETSTTAWGQEQNAVCVSDRDQSK